MKRRNRFVGEILVGGKPFTCHISDTGRLRELFRKGAGVLVSHNREGLKTDFRLVAVRKGDEWVLVNTSVHSRIARKIVEMGFLGFTPESVRGEVRAGRSRIDLLIDGKLYVEVKGVNLSMSGICLFPDAPTKRGVKHLLELVELKRKGFEAAMMALSFVKCDCFLPNRETDEEFSRTFELALGEGVKFFGFRLGFEPETGCILLRGELPLCR